MNCNRPEPAWRCMARHAPGPRKRPRRRGWSEARGFARECFGLRAENGKQARAAVVATALLNEERRFAKLGVTANTSPADFTRGAPHGGQRAYSIGSLLIS